MAFRGSYPCTLLGATLTYTWTNKSRDHENPKSLKIIQRLYHRKYEPDLATDGSWGLYQFRVKVNRGERLQRSYRQSKIGCSIMDSCHDNVIFLGVSGNLVDCHVHWFWVRPTSFLIGLTPKTNRPLNNTHLVLLGAMQDVMQISQILNFLWTRSSHGLV